MWAVLGGRPRCGVAARGGTGGSRTLLPISFPFPRLLSVIFLVSYLRRKGNCRNQSVPIACLSRSAPSPLRCSAVMPALCPRPPSRLLTSRAQPCRHLCGRARAPPSSRFTCRGPSSPGPPASLSPAPRPFSASLPLDRAPPFRYLFFKREA